MKLFLLGILTWTLVEYLAHRFLHVITARTHLWGHHRWPSDYTIGPSWTSIATFNAVLMGACVLLGVPWFAVGYIVGFAFYARIHYLCHHVGQPWQEDRLRLWLRRNHNIHHYHDGNKNFGVSSPLWDVVFRTYKRAP